MMLYQKRTLKQILVEGVSLYTKHWFAVTKPFVFPLLLQVIGVTVWVVLSYEAVEWTTAFPVWLRWMLFAGANLIGMGMFVRGFWDYLIWFSALNLLVRDLAEGNPVLDGDAYTLRVTNRSMDYSLVWLFLFALFFIPVGFAVVPVVVGGNFPEWTSLSFLVAGAIFLIGMLAALVLTLFSAMVFQVFVFQPASAGACLFRSADLVRLNIVKVLVVSVVAVLITQNLLPMAVTWLCDLLHITNAIGQISTKPFVDVLQKSAEMALALEDQYPAYLVAVYKLILAAPAQLTLELARWIIYTLAAAVAVSLGTCWFTLLYGDLKAFKDEEKGGQAILTTSAGQIVSAGD